MTRDAGYIQRTNRSVSLFIITAEAIGILIMIAVAIALTNFYTYLTA